jgi:hypothetical protein
MCELENLVNDDRRRRAADHREQTNPLHQIHKSRFPPSAERGEKNNINKRRGKDPYSKRENLRQPESRNHARAENFEFLSHPPSKPWVGSGGGQ